MTRIDDVGVASLARTIDAVDGFRDQDVLIVAAGREGALPTVVAGLVDVPASACPSRPATATAARVRPLSRDCSSPALHSLS